MYKPIFAFLTFFFAAASAFSQADWKLTTREKNISVFFKDVPNSRVKALKVVCEVDANVVQVVALLLDVPAAKNWVCHTRLSRMLRKVSSTELYYYTDVSLPWPLYNRDFVTHMRVYQNPATKIVVVEAPAISGEVPVKRGLVRVSEGRATWIIRPLANNRAGIEYTLVVDPGGVIPANVVNYFASQGAIETVSGMMEQLRLPKYQNPEIPFIQK
jgi:hypothetical protein